MSTSFIICLVCFEFGVYRDVRRVLDVRYHTRRQRLAPSTKQTVCKFLLVFVFCVLDQVCKSVKRHRGFIFHKAVLLIVSDFIDTVATVSQD